MKTPGADHDQEGSGRAVGPEVGLTAGTGHIEVRSVGGRSLPTRAQSAAPLKLLTPRRRTAAAWIYISSFGGGLVAGDRLHLYADVHPGSTAVLTTQAATKVFHQQDGVGAEQSLHATVAPGATLVVAPDPLTCFADAAYTQRQTFDLVGDASLVLLDWVTCGRVACDERWVFDRYESTNRIRVDGREVVFDRLRLDATQAPGWQGAADAFATGPYNVLATLFFVGPAARPGADAAAAWADALGASGGASGDAPHLQASFSPQAWGGVLRVMGSRTQQITGALKQRLDFLEPRLGAGVWSRRA